jgi:predicted metalloprotease
MFRDRAPIGFAAIALVVAGCGVDASVTAERADRVAIVVPPIIADDDTNPDAGSGATLTPSDPRTSEPPASTSPAPPDTAIDGSAIDFGPDKPPKAYDEFLLAVLTDLELWWGEAYPTIYGGPFRPLEGGVYAAYPGRPGELPGCGSPITSYDDVQQYVAFYCGVGDFIIYDDGDDGLLTELAREFGAGTIGTVLAHEYAHAIQLRIGALDRALPTILTEQQADCFAGAWTGRAARGEAATVRYSDGDVRAGLIAMTKVADPVGVDQFTAGGHGSGFDRVGAFQVGFLEGPARCAEILDAPLPLTPNLLFENEVATGGNAPFGYGDDELMGFLPQDLNDFWDLELADRFPDLGPLRLTVVRSLDDVDCDDLRGDLARGTALCASTDRVYFYEPAALELYRTFGDFSVGYLLGKAWGEAVQESIDSELTGEERVLVNDCLTGAWVQTVTPVETGDPTQLFELPQPRLDGRTVTVSAGDLDEAIQTVLLIADLDADDDVIGNAFEKIDALRTGVIDGLDACLAEL